MTDLYGRHFVISGKVQGVWYRASTKTKAQELGLTGWVRNLPDGRVEVVAYGEETQLANLHDWLKLGPPQAAVTEVIVHNIPWQQHSSFAIV